LLRLLFNLNSLVLADTFNTEATLFSERRDVSLDRVANAFAVVSLSELWDHSLALHLAHEPVRQIAFKVTTHLREVLAILNRDDEQETSLLAVFRSNAPAARDCE
jgi:hypothetical protein